MNQKHGWFSRTESLPNLDKKKYLVPDLTYSQFLGVVRKRLKLEPEKAMYMFVGDEEELPPNGVTMNELYEQFKDEDGFLYFSVAGLSVFGYGSQ